MIAILGNKDRILPYQAIGIRIFPCDVTDAKTIGEQIVNNYQVIFYTPEIYPAIKDIIARYQKSPLPCFALLPSLEEAVSAERIAELVKKATGTDLLKKR
ncbi:MAG: V-type ATP synthase subunit F [candidate division WOR-3 bacterium]